MSRITGFLMLSILGGAACAPPVPTVTEADLEAIRTHRTTFAEAVRAGNLDQVASLYSETALVLAPNEPMHRGRIAIRTAIGAWPPIGEFAMSGEEFTPLGGDAVLVTGRYAMTVMPPGLNLAVADSGKFLEVWRREGDTWRIGWDAFNTSLPLPAPPPPPPARRR